MKKIIKQSKKTTEMVDLISELLDPIVHHVMSFLPTADAAKICVLSKRFRSAWNSFPIIVFDEKYFPSYGLSWSSRHKLDVILTYLIRRCFAVPDMISLDKFVFHVKLIDDEDRLNWAINFAIEKNVKELDLDSNPRVRKYINRVYNKLPREVFESRSIRVLKLKGFEFDPSNSNSMIPFIEDLSLDRCKGPKRLKISGSRLRSFRLDYIWGSKEIDIEASNLEFFSYANSNKEISLIDENDRIEQCEINIAGCKSIKYLSLKGTDQITDEWLASNLLQFPLLETLKLSGCNKLESLYVESGNNNILKTIELDKCVGLKYIKMDTLNLESFVYNGESRSHSCEIDIRACRFLKSLELHWSNVTDQWIEDNMLQFPFLEYLILSACNLLEKIKISDNHTCFKDLQLLDCTRLKEVEIEARNLGSFSYSGDLLPLPLLIDSSLLHANLSVNRVLNPPTNDWFKRLRDFLGFFDHCKVLSLHCKFDKLLIIPEELKDSLLPPLFDIKHLKVETSSSSPESLKMLVESLLWLSPLPETISIFFDQEKIKREKLLKFQYDMAPIAEEEYQFCCRNRLIKCWKHYVNKLTMENFDDLEEKLLSNFFEGNAVRL